MNHSSLLSQLLKKVKIIGLVICLFVATPKPIGAGNPTPHLLSVIAPYFVVNTLLYFSVSIFNPYFVACPDWSYFFRVTDTDTGKEVFKESKTIDVGPGEERVIYSEGGMLPTYAGTFKLEFNASSINDIDNANNYLFTEFTIKPEPNIQPYNLTLEQGNISFPYQQQDSRILFFSFPYLPEDIQEAYVNALVKQPEQSNEDAAWAIQNFHLDVAHTPIGLTIPFDMGEIGVEDGQDVTELDVSISITDELGDRQVIPFTFTKFDVGELDYHVGTSNDPDLDLSVYPMLSLKQAWNLAASTTKIKRDDVPNIDLDASEYPEDINGCAPASCANSMMWLEEGDFIPWTDLDLSEMYYAMSYFMGRENGYGVTTTDVIRGKLDYIDYYRLPVHVKYQSIYIPDQSVSTLSNQYDHKAENKMGPTGQPDFDWLKGEMEHDEDVELLFGWYDEEGNRVGGHWVTLSGLIERGDVKGIYFKDDFDQQNEGGTREVFVDWLEDNNGHVQLSGLKYRNLSCRVESVVSESYDPTVQTGLRGINLFQLRRDAQGLGFSDKGLIRFNSLPSEQAKILNVFGTNPYTLEPKWIVKNQFIPPSQEELPLNALFNIKTLGVDEFHLPMKIDLGIQVGADFITSQDDGIPQEYFKSFDLNIEQDLLREQSYLTEDIKILPRMTGSGIVHGLEVPISMAGQPITWIDRSEASPNIDLNNGEHNPETTEGYAGDRNACAPAAAANSMEWLDVHHGDAINTGLSHREKLEELSKLMEREDTSGVAIENFIKGKLAFIDKYKLPIQVKFQCMDLGTDSIPSPDNTYGHYAVNHNDSAGAVPTWDWLVNEMEEDEDVEMMILYVDENDSITGGHMVMVTGVSDVGTAKGFYFKDDIDQEHANGTEETYVNWVDEDGITYLPQLSDTSNQAFVYSIVSESYDSTVTHQIDGVSIYQYDWMDLFSNEYTLQGGFLFDANETTSGSFITVYGWNSFTNAPVLLIENIPVPEVSTTTQFASTFSLEDLGFDDGEIVPSVQLDVKITDDVLSVLDDYEPVSFAKYTVEIKERTVLQALLADPIEFIFDDFDPAGFIELPAEREGVVEVFREDMKYNVDLDSSKYKPDESYAGDWNACAPASAANSMHWLEQTHDSIPKKGTTLRDKLVEISNDMSRKDTAGPSYTNFIKGKLQYIDDNNLPIKVKFQSIYEKSHVTSPVMDYGHYARNDNDPGRSYPTFSWIKQEIDHGEDVEMTYYRYDTVAKKVDGAHAVTISGYYQSKTDSGLYIFDDWDQTQTNSYWLRNDIVQWHDNEKYGYIKDGSPTIKVVNAVFSESYDSTINFVPVVDKIQIRKIRKIFRDFEGTLGTKPEFELIIKDDGKRYLSVTTSVTFGEGHMVFNYPIDKKGTISMAPIVTIENTKSSLLASDTTLLIGLTLSEDPIQADTTPEFLIEIPDIESEAVLTNDAAETTAIAASVNSTPAVPMNNAPVEIYMMDLPQFDLIGQANAAGIAGSVDALQTVEEQEANLNLDVASDALFELIEMQSGASSGEGVSTTDLISGNLGAIDSLKVPVGIAFQSYAITDDAGSPDDRYGHTATNAGTENGSSPEWDWIMNQLLSGHSILLSYGLYDTTGTRLAGQWAQVSGYINEAQLRGLYLNRDDDQENEGGMRTIYTNWLDTLNYASLDFYNWDIITCWVESAVAFSYDETMTFVEQPDGVNSLNQLEAIAYRNPSSLNEIINIRFRVKDAKAPVFIQIYDAKGAVVWRYDELFETPGTKIVQWNGQENSKNRVVSGVYFVKILQGNQASVLKLIRE